MRSFLLATAVSLFAISCGSSTDESTTGDDDTGSLEDSASTSDSSTTSDTGAATDSASSTDSTSSDSTSADSSSTDSGSKDSSSTDALPDGAGGFCGGIAGKMCPAGYFCQSAAGMCKVPDAGGTCVAVPATCSKELVPVCGCDGKTYDNACLAQKASVSIDHTGACATSGKTCGGKTGATCGKTEFCDYPDGAMCGAFDSTGVCTTRPTICPGVVIPICGCDGVTHNNACEAHRAGFDDNHTGACP